ncbi:hypothetical protein HDV63DRAFT_369675 [Trichoderma sp. SZMC 28014]
MSLSNQTHKSPKKETRGHPREKKNATRHQTIPRAGWRAQRPGFSGFVFFSGRFCSSCFLGALGWMLKHQTTNIHYSLFGPFWSLSGDKNRLHSSGQGAGYMGLQHARYSRGTCIEATAVG